MTSMPMIPASVRPISPRNRARSPVTMCAGPTSVPPTDILVTTTGAPPDLVVDAMLPTVGSRSDAAMPASTKLRLLPVSTTKVRDSSPSSVAEMRKVPSRSQVPGTLRAPLVDSIGAVGVNANVSSAASSVVTGPPVRPACAPGPGPVVMNP